jgi:predicted dehydrogenase
MSSSLLSKPTVLVLGAGSIGIRHAGNLVAAGAHVSIADPVPERARAVQGVRAVPFDLDRLEGYDGIVVASPTAYHREQAEAAIGAGAHVLVEKPLATSTERLDQLLTAGTGRIMVGYNLRLHDPVRRLVSLVHDGRAGRPLSVRLWFGSYLPDWRAGVDYRGSYSARSDLGGGILLDASHELDLLLWILGERLEVVGAVVERLGDLEIDVEDTVRALLRHESGIVAEVALDLLSRRYRRGIEVIGDSATLRLDWARQVIEIEDRHEVRSEEAATPIDHSYEREARIFLAFVSGESEPPVDGFTAAASIRLAERILGAAR